MLPRRVVSCDKTLPGKSGQRSMLLGVWVLAENAGTAVRTAVRTETDLTNSKNSKNCENCAPAEAVQATSPLQSMSRKRTVRSNGQCFLFIKSINCEGATRSMVRKFQKHISQLMVADFKQSMSGSWVLWLNNSYCPFSTFFPFSHLCSEGFIKRWQWIMRGAKGEISRPSHSLSSL